MGTATTQALLTIIWGLHIGEDCERTSASRCARTQAGEREAADASNGLLARLLDALSGGTDIAPNAMQSVWHGSMSA
jgi:hypothetical protein